MTLCYNHCHLWKTVSVICEQNRVNLAILNGYRENNVMMMMCCLPAELIDQRGVTGRPRDGPEKSELGTIIESLWGKARIWWTKRPPIWLHPSLHLLSICSEFCYWLFVKILLKRMLHGQTQRGHFSLKLQTNWDQIRGTWDGSIRNQLVHMLWWCHWQAIGEQTSFRLRSQETWASTATLRIFTETIVYHIACVYKLRSDLTKASLDLPKFN